MKNIGTTLPPLYNNWMDQLLQKPIPNETEAACQDCPMCSHDAQKNKSEFVFDVATKCCTYIPEIPNFLAGQILLDKDPEFEKGRSAFEEQMTNHLIVTPLGVSPRSEYWAMYRHATDNSAFGQTPGLLCPYFLPGEGGKCGIWRHRNSRCATWFCKYVRGSVGVIFWKYMDQLLSEIERRLSEWCILQLDIGLDALELLFPPPPSERVSGHPEIFWGNWRGREREFFLECGKLVNVLSWQDVENICGAELRLIGQLTKKAFVNLTSFEVPSVLRVAQWKKVMPINADVYRVWTYNQYDPIDLSKAMLESLHYFDGRPTADAVQSIFDNNRLRLENSDLRRLTDFGVLTSA
ncbi:MAG TPA: hypothetical protein VLH08_17605 [Acidobacteriota bacterium]|nr:hypothetical protein [Acidobacteriota bacterium]